MFLVSAQVNMSKTVNYKLQYTVFTHENCLRNMYCLKSAHYSHIASGVSGISTMFQQFQHVNEAKMFPILGFHLVPKYPLIFMLHEIQIREMIFFFLY